MNTIAPGTVISGTRSVPDLLHAFADTLGTYGAGDEDALLILLARHWTAILEAFPDTDVPDPQDTLDDLIERLEALAPEGHYFGTHPDDGADFGFWPSDTRPDTRPDTSLDDWKREVAAGDTWLGFAEWCEHREAPASPSAIAAAYAAAENIPVEHLAVPAPPPIEELGVREVWIVKGETTDGSRVEWQFSDGPVGQRGESSDYTDLEAGLREHSGCILHWDAVANDALAAVAAPVNFSALETAACLWEACLKFKDADNSIGHIVSNWFEIKGTAEVRSTVISWHAECDAAYTAAVATGYDDSFDWEFVPQWLATKLREKFNLTTKEN